MSPSLGSKPITLRSNSFAITQLPKFDYIQYDEIVAFTDNPNRRGPSTDPRKNQQVFQHLQNRVAPDIFNPRVIYDGRSIAYARGQPLRLPGNNAGRFIIHLNQATPLPTESRGSVTITLTQTIGPHIRPNDVFDLTRDKKDTTRAKTATNLLQLIVRQGPNLVYTNNGRAYFRGDQKKVIGSGLELWRGIFQSVRPTLGKMILTIDTCTAAVYTGGPLIDVCLNFLGLRDVRQLVLRPTDPAFRELSKFLKNLRITVQTGGGRSRTKTIRALEPAAGLYVFATDGGAETNVESHFWSAHSIRVLYPRIIGVHLAGKKAPHPDIVPAELCTVITGQLWRNRIPEHLTKDVVSFSTMKPQERLSKIIEGIQGYHQSEFVAESEMRIDTNPLEVPAKLLNTPRVIYGPQQEVTARNGGWNVLGKQFHQPAQLRYWAVINFCPEIMDLRSMDKMVHEILSCCKNLDANDPIVVDNGLGPDVEQSLYALLRKVVEKVPQLKADPSSFILFVVLPDKAGNIRNRVKFWGDCTMGVLTNCVMVSKAKKGGSQYFNNVALKLNARLGGCNSHASGSPVMQELMQKPYIVIGADVSHPGPGMQKPSIASLVFSHDRHAAQYMALTSIQEPREEMIQDLKELTQRALKTFARKPGNAPPARIIFFRDGVSEGEFDKVIAVEIKAIQEACIEIDQNYRPQITFMVVGKRHHAVFFPRSPNEADQKGNCHAGSVVESGVTHPSGVDFYLQSHAAILGTPRSGHYTVLRDDVFQYDLRKLQELAFTLCHVYAKATRSVSIPAPLVCARGAFHLDPKLNLQFDDSASSSSGGRSTFDLGMWKDAFMPVNKGIDRSMYFL
ncbi:argonaute-like protein [Crassisporium funariophilum]|nr:argonaute-like protein [Crassisporium funariophilum]